MKLRPNPGDSGVIGTFARKIALVSKFFRSEAARCLSEVAHCFAIHPACRCYQGVGGVCTVFNTRVPMDRDKTPLHEQGTREAAPCGSPLWLVPIPRTGAKTGKGGLDARETSNSPAHAHARMGSHSDTATGNAFTIW